jgi:hypothetical protein
MSEAIKTKIAALLNKKTSNGATEAEAMAALRIAQKLMDEHGVTEADILANTDAAKDFLREVVRDGRKNLHEADLYCIATVAEFCGVKVWQNKEYNGSIKIGVNINFFGYNADVETAKFIREVLFRAMEWEWAVYSNSLTDVGHKRTIRKSFMVGMANRINQRLRDIKTETRASGGTSLIILKNQMVTEEYNRQVNIHLKKGTATKIVINNGSAYRAGQNAGSKVSLSRAETSQGARQIAAY